MTTSQTSAQGGKPSGEGAPLAIPITAQNYPVLHRWMQLDDATFGDEMTTLAALGREETQPDDVQRAVGAAVSALEALHRRRST
ncbi:MAG: hypothetical protein ACRD2Z_13665 [Thermoanaerobaculia bacterium]